MMLSRRVPVRACLSAVLALFTGAGAGFGAPAPPDTLVAHVTRQSELYAPTERDLFRVSRQLDYAALQFERHVGERAPRIPVYVCSSEAQARARVPSPGAPSSARYLVWIGPTQKTPAAGAKRAAPPGAARRPASAAAEDADPEAAFMHAYGHAMVDGWAARARGAAAPAAPGVTGLAPGDAAKHATDRALPAWFQEAIAGLCEPVRSQHDRIEAARAALARRIPFAELFAGPVPAEPARASLFINESLALMRFIVEREDEPFLRQIAVGLVAGKPTPEVLVNAKTIYSRPEVLEKQWAEWMSRSPAPAN